jgi:hypothetical protein
VDRTLVGLEVAASLERRQKHRQSGLHGSFDLNDVVEVS